MWASSRLRSASSVLRAVPQKAAAPEETENTDAYPQGQNQSRVNQKPSVIDLQKGQVVHHPFDYPGNEKLQQVDDDQAQQTEQDGGAIGQADRVE